MNLLKGQKVDVAKGRSLQEAVIRIGWKTDNAQMEIDRAAFLLSEAGRCEQDQNLIFYGNPASSNGAVNFSKLGQGDQEQISINLSRLTPDIQKIAITLTIYEGEKLGHHFGNVSHIYLRLSDGISGEQLFQFEFGSELTKETAIVVGELYLYKGDWKFNAVGSGFNGGLAALCNNFGIEVIEDEESEVAAAASVAEANKTVQSAAPSRQLQPEANSAKASSPLEAPSPKPITHQKIELKKQEAVSIAKSTKITAMLKWDNPRKDLDLYCFYVLKNGKSDKIYYRNLGSATKSPYIELDKDSKHGGIETITIHRTEELKYVLFAAYSAISNGFGSFKSMKARAVVDNHAVQTVTAPLLQNNRFAYWVAIAKIDFTEPNTIVVSHVETYSKSGSERSPLLYEDGSFAMNLGPIEFKR